MNRQRTAGFALALLGTFLCISSISTGAHADVTQLHAFQPLLAPYNDGADPYSCPIQASDGNFYGTTYHGGLNNTGALYKVSLDGTVTTLYSFSALDQNGVNSDGAHPYASLTQGTDGNFYGTATMGGANASGTVFKITPAGAFTVLHAFYGTGSEGSFPEAPLVQGGDGSFYGTTHNGGAYDRGTVFHITGGGTFTVLYTFQGGFDGAYPAGGLTLGNDGNLYGATYMAGAYNSGTVFRITPTGALTTLHAFSSLSGSPSYTNADGAFPLAGLVKGNDGNFYGTAWKGGQGTGTVFRITPDGIFTTLHSFGTLFGAAGEIEDGVYPRSALTLGRNGDLYGITYEEGGNGGGTIFKVTPQGNFIPVVELDPSWMNVQSNSMPSVIQGSDGALYGAADFYEWGMVYRADVNAFDFFSNGQPSLLFQNAASGQLALWSMNGAAATRAALITTTPNPGWKAVGIGDFDLDTHPDIVLQNGTTGQIIVWYMNGTKAFTGAYLAPKQDPAWQVVSVADVNGDGHPDLLFQNQNTGQLAVWYMNGSTAIQASYITPTPPAGWKAIGTGDFNGDGKQELLFQNPTTGQMALWFFQGGPSASGAAYITPGQSASWQAVSVMDVNGDGKADIVFQNKTTGLLAVWYVNGTTASGAAYITPNQLSGWQVVGPH
ncbi:MAG TPA: choice-of-anchor tandem repeat GloVer-containing protein [Chthonomonadaceae bacterium]|nr:choice-of-anchor tandem repeat GloVer-containing protein [Chthonomonadaceae bacterium]